MPHPLRTRLLPRVEPRPVARSHAGASLGALRHSAVAVLLATSALVNPPQALAQSALPQGGQVAAGSVSIAGDGPNGLRIDQTSNRAIVNWGAFSVGAGHAVTFVQPSAEAAILNRVTGAAASEIAGLITGNGRVYLVNPNGIAITTSGTVRLDGGFVASTLDIADDDFLADRLVFRGTGHSAGVSHAGTLSVGAGGFAALLGGQVSSTGRITVPLGSIGLGAGEAATLDLTGDGFLQLALPSSAPGRDPLLAAAGQLSGARIELRAATVADALREVVHVSGALTARGAHREGGVIVLDGGAGSTRVTGTLDAASAEGAGGTILVGGAAIDLVGARLDASGLTGGTVAVGGGFAGAPVGQLDPARAATIDGASVIEASGLAGRGGDVTVWGGNHLDYAGTIRATGTGGDGGAAEVSGLGQYRFAGTVDLRSATGRTGTLTLDPYNITISTDADANVSGFTATGSGAKINATTLQNALASANVTVATGSSGSEAGDITVASPLTWSADTTLTLNAAGAIAINAGITNSGTSSGLTLSADGTGGITGTGGIANSGALTLNLTNAGASSTLSSVVSGPGALIKSGAGTLALSGSNSYSGVTTVNAGTLAITGSLNVGAGTAAMVAGTGATLSGSGVITAGTLALGGAGTVDLTGANAIGTLLTSGSSGTLRLNNASALTLGTISTTGPLTLFADSLSLATGGTVATSGVLTLAPYSNLSIGIGTASTGTFKLGDAFLAALSAGSYAFGSQTTASGAATSTLMQVSTTRDFGNSNVSFVSGGAINLFGTLTKASGTGTASYQLSAGTDIYNSASAGIAATAGKINLTLRSNARGAGSGAVLFTGGTIATGGGNITIGGGSGVITAGTGFAVGSGSAYAYGVQINSTVNAGGGDILINGQGAA